MINQLYFFCFLVLLVFSCRSVKEVSDSDQVERECKLKAWMEYEQAENYFYKEEYRYARVFYVKTLTYDCLNGMKIGKGRKKIAFTDLINRRIVQIDTIAQRERREKIRTCKSLLKEADTLYARENYDNSGRLYRRYLSDCCPAKDKMAMNAKILKADSLAKVKDSLAKERKCSFIREEADRLYRQKNYQRSLEFYQSYEYWACPVKDSNYIMSKKMILDSLIKLEKE